MDCSDALLKMTQEEIKELENQKVYYQKKLNNSEAILMYKHKVARDLQNGKV